MTAETALHGGQSTALYRMLRRIARSRLLPIGLIAASVVSGTLTYAALTETWASGADASTLYVLFIVDLSLLLALGVLVAQGIIRIWAERKRGAAGSRLHGRIALTFGVIAITPSVFIAAFSALFFNLGIQAWFSDRVRLALEESRFVADAYLEEHKKTLRADVMAISDQLASAAVAGRLNADSLNRFLARQSDMRNLSEAIMFEGNGVVIARAALSFGIALEGVPAIAIREAERGDVVFLTSESDDRVRALTRVAALPNTYLYVGRLVDPRVVAQAEQVRAAVDLYVELEGRRVDLERTFALIYLMVSLLLLLVVLWLGLRVANWLVRPISELVDAAELVGAGDLTVRVDERPDHDDEIAGLSRAFNRMTTRLETQQRELMEANQLVDRRRRFTEAVLEGVTAGVLRIEADGSVSLANRVAVDLISWDGGSPVGRNVRKIVPEFLDLLKSAENAPYHVATDHIVVTRQAQRRTLLARVTAEQADDEGRAMVITFDDITDLMAAQRTAAWADVARRIAHEIKNPLTPIQLSAERLRRKYLKQIETDPDSFQTCTDTIIRQVNTIGKMIDEFSNFARMPAPTFREENIVEILKQAVFLQQQAWPEIKFENAIEEKSVALRCDARHVGQVLTNVLKNAGEAISEAHSAAPAGPTGSKQTRGSIAMSLETTETHVIVRIADSGPGVPEELISRLSEPYVTTRAKGTGLGLAIVRKIMEDHDGRFEIANRPEGGALTTLTFSRRLAESPDTPPDPPKTEDMHDR